MRPKIQERGQALVIIALAVVGLFGFSALAIDGSRVFSDRRNAQNAADTAALSAALAKIRGESYADAAVERADSNGYATDANSTVEVYLCNDPLITTPCEGLPGGSDPADYIQVKITSIIPSTFARIVGRDQFTNIVTAIAYAGPVDPKPLVNGSALAALKENGDATLAGNGVVHLDVNNSGVFNNSVNNCGTQIDGASGSYTVDTSFQFVSGNYCNKSGKAVLDPVQDVNPIPYPPQISIPIPSISCGGTPGGLVEDKSTVPSTWIFTPGDYPSGVTLNQTGDVIFKDGNYCFGGNVSLGGTANIIADNVKFLIYGGEFSTNGTSKFTCYNMLVHINGGTGVRFNGNSAIYCNHVTFVASTGDVSWSGNVGIRMYAPDGGDYENVLIYMPHGNNSALTITGNSANELKGSIIAVSSDIKIAGNSGTTGLHSQIIGYTVTLEGSSNTVINYAPDEQYLEPFPSDIKLTK
jgi:hypothetical protein